MMKRFLAMMLACLLFCGMTNAALANSFGLSGGIYDIVSDDNAYDSYTSCADDGNKKLDGVHVNHAVMRSRYHAQLIAAFREGKEWACEVVSTTAVYQPGDSRAERVELKHTDDGFCLSYGGTENYYFVRQDGDYILSRVFFDEGSGFGDSLVWYEDESVSGYQYWDGGLDGGPIGDALWQVEQVKLSAFNINQIPRSMGDVRRMNHLMGCFTAAKETGDLMQNARAWEGEKNGVKLAVYSAPDENSFRASSGKASVSTGGDMTLIGMYGEWTMIAYEVSSRTSRIGFVKAELSDDLPALPLLETAVDVVAARDTFLTDDPFVSQYEQVQLSAGTVMKYIGHAGDYYAYVTCEQGGKLFWGFVPLRDLRCPFREADEPLIGFSMNAYVPARWDVMETLIGKWEVTAGGSLMYERMVLYSDGTYCAYTRDENYRLLMAHGGHWWVYDVSADYTHAGEPLYEIFFHGEGGERMDFGLFITEDGLITVVSGGEEGSYERVEYSTYGNG